MKNVFYTDKTSRSKAVVGFLQPVLRLYDIPDESFESDNEEEESDVEEEDAKPTGIDTWKNIWFWLVLFYAINQSIDRCVFLL